MNIQLLQHSLGLNQYGQGQHERNKFVTGPESEDFIDCGKLVVAGFMADHGAKSIFGGMHIFTVTPNGVDYVKANSPAAPIPLKLTRGKQNYQDYLRSEVSESFGWWIKHRNS